jgi:cyclophilin family peptidyl-prolyl cis-trans isomerase
MVFPKCIIGVLGLILLAVAGLAAPTIDPLANVTIPAGKSLILPVTATSPSGRPLAYTVTSSTNAIAVVLHTNNPFWQLAVAQAAPANAPGAYQTPYRGSLVTVTNVGTLTFLLFPEYAPHTVNVFQGLTESGFYNSNTIFHRVVSNFVIQGGDPKTNGTGGLVFQYDDEFNPQAIFSGNGQLALANSGENTDGSQFFVTIGAQRSLDFSYTLFGQLVRGFNVLTNISLTAVNTGSRPLADEIIQTAGYVTNTTDTVLTLTATNISGVTGKITVIVNDGAGGLATNTFTVATATDANSNYQPFIYPNTVTNLVSPVNVALTNNICAVELDGLTLYWFPLYEDVLSSYASTLSGNYSDNVLKTLTYNETNADGQVTFAVAPVSNYTGPINLSFVVSPSPSWYYDYTHTNPLPPYDQQQKTYIFGDALISGQTNAVTVLTATPFTNVLMAAFTNGVPNSAAANFAAAINWGDDTITSGTIGTNAAGQKTVLGAHTYPYPGNYPVYVQVQSAVGAGATILSWVKVISLALVPPASGQGLTNGFNFSLQVTPGSVGHIQVSTNLTSWTTLTNFTGTNATLTFHDPAAANAGARFYRAMVP